MAKVFMYFSIVNASGWESFQTFLRLAKRLTS